VQDDRHVINWVAEKLVKLRRESGSTSYENFAFDNELPRVQYWRLEKGKSDFRISSLVKVLKAHDMNLKEFFSDFSDTL